MSGLRYTRVSADILFDMRLAMYRHLQRLSPRFYARTRLGDVDVAHQQRHRRDPAHRRRNRAGLGRQRAVPRSAPSRCWPGSTRGCSSSTAATRAARRLGAGALPRAGSRPRWHVVRQRSADIGSFLIETLQAMRLVVASNAQEREVARFRARNDAFVARADVDAAADVSVGRPARADPVRWAPARSSSTAACA